VCRSQHDTVDATEITQKILSGIIKTNNRFGKAHVLKVLRGSKEQKIIDRSHDSLSVWGVAKDIPENVLNEVFMQLIAHGFIQRNDGEYPTFFVTKSGKSFLTNKEILRLPRVQEEMLLVEPDPVPTQKNRPEKKRPKARSKKILLTDERCFAELKILRKKLADEKGVPAFIIFGDASLHDMSYKKPRNTKEFQDITGVGEKKLVEYGEIFLTAIREYQNTQASD
jgi:ATP-dependent DNA helicase RecQ